MPQLIGQGGTITLEAFFTDSDGNAHNPTSPLISIIDATGDTIVGPITPDTHVGTGHYTHDYDIDDEATLGAWEAHWSGIINGAPVTADEGFTVVASGSIITPSPAAGDLITIADLAEFIRLPINTIDHDAAEHAIHGASALVRDEVGQAIDYTPDDVVELESPGGKLLLLPELPVIDVTVVRIRRPGDAYETLVAGTDYEVSLRTGKIWRINHHEWPRANGRGLSGFIEVTNSHGYDLPGGDTHSGVDPLPETLATVVKRVAARGYQNPEAVSQETTGRGNVTVYSNPGLYLSDGDKRDLDKFRPGSRGGSR